MAYVQRTPPQGDMDAMAQETLEDPAVFQAGARLMKEGGQMLPVYMTVHADAEYVLHLFCEQRTFVGRNEKHQKENINTLSKIKST